MKKDIEWLKSWFDDDKSYTGEYVKFKINHYRWGDEVEKEQKYYAKLKEVRPPEKGWLTNLTGSNYYVIDTKGLMLGEFILDLVGLKTEASTHTLKDWERYGINDSNADFVKVE